MTCACLENLQRKCVGGEEGQHTTTQHITPQRNKIQHTTTKYDATQRTRTQQHTATQQHSRTQHEYNTLHKTENTTHTHATKSLNEIYFDFDWSLNFVSLLCVCLSLPLSLLCRLVSRAFVFVCLVFPSPFSLLVVCLVGSLSACWLVSWRATSAQFWQPPTIAERRPGLRVFCVLSLALSCLWFSLFFLFLHLRRCVTIFYVFCVCPRRRQIEPDESVLSSLWLALC